MRFSGSQRLTAALCCLLLLLAMLACMHFAPDSSTVSGSDITWQTVDWNASERMVGVYVPEGVVNPAPLVLVLHGGGGSAAKTWNQEHGRSWRALADRDGFVLVLPEGHADLDDADAHHWNDCRTGLDPSIIATNEDDVGFVLDLIERVSGTTTIDRDRIYVTGVSNGGMMTYRLAIEASETFAAAAAIIANLPDPSECGATETPIPILIMNGTDDPLMPYEGGCVAGDSCQRGRVMSTQDTVTFWVEINHASTVPAVERLPNRAWFDRSTVSVYRFDGGAVGVDVVYYHIKGGGHNVPGFESDPLLARALAGPKNRDIDGPAEIWSFFQQVPSLD